VALAERLAAALPDTLVAPALPVGCSDEHQGFAGLLSLDCETLARVIVDCARRMGGWGAERLLILSAHGGNGDALDLAESRLAKEMPGLRVTVLGCATALSEAILAVAAKEGIAAETVGLHAGEGETSEMLALRPDLVLMERIVPGCREDLADLMPRLRQGGLRSVTPTGTLGDAREADGARGARYLAAEIEGFRRAVAASLAVEEG
jgi:creatinine amidohydrolase